MLAVDGSADIANLFKKCESDAGWLRVPFEEKIGLTTRSQKVALISFLQQDKAHLNAHLSPAPHTEYVVLGLLYHLG